MAPDPGQDPRRQIPALDGLLKEPEISALCRLYGRASVVVQARQLLAERRAGSGLTEGEIGRSWVQALAREIPRRLEVARGGASRRVLNATGVFLHTNLGRSPIEPEVWRSIEDRVTAACDLEIDLESGERGDRNRRLEALLREATGAAAALVVNNNAAALVLALASLGEQAGAARGEVVVSRGELVEIGGSFRIPDILETAGVRLREVGTTNRTRLADYEAAIGPSTVGLLKVHPSNYKVRGFTESVDEASLAALARRRGVPWLADEGAGLLRPSGRAALRGHASLSRLVELGCHLACGSGDKLLGGPQAGLLVGEAVAIERCRRHPWYRVVRPGRTVALLLEETLRRRLAGVPAPFERLWPSPPELLARLERLRQRLGAGEIVEAGAQVGGGAAADEQVIGAAWSLEHPRVEGVLRQMRLGDPPVVAVARRGRLWIDLRSVDPRDDDELADTVARALAP
jgi:L-seryl-tRNA(Ser) seleniumtransferase